MSQPEGRIHSQHRRYRQLPAGEVLTNADLAKFGVDTSDEWIVARTGIRQRHVAAEGELTSDLAYHAAMRAMEAAGVGPADLDLIVVGHHHPDLIFRPPPPSSSTNWAPPAARRSTSTPHAPASSTR